MPKKNAAKRGGSKLSKKKRKKSGIIKGKSPKKIIALLDSWRKDESGYDERTWPILKQALERNRHPFERTEMSLYDQIQESSQTIKKHWPGRPRVGIILGTGLGGLTQDIQKDHVFAYE